CGPINVAFSFQSVTLPRGRHDGVKTVRGHCHMSRSSGDGLGCFGQLRRVRPPPNLPQPFASSAGHSRTGNGRSTQICSAPDALATSLNRPATSSDTCSEGTVRSNVQNDATPDSSYTLRLSVASYRLVLGESTSMTSTGATTRSFSVTSDRRMT